MPPFEIKQTLEERLWELREEYLKNIKEYSFNVEKDLKPKFQTVASYQEISTKHFLEFALKRLDFKTLK